MTKRPRVHIFPCAHFQGKPNLGRNARPLAEAHRTGQHPQQRAQHTWPLMCATLTIFHNKALYNFVLERLGSLLIFLKFATKFACSLSNKKCNFKLDYNQISSKRNINSLSMPDVSCVVFFYCKSQILKRRQESFCTFHSSEHNIIYNLICMFLWRLQDRQREDQKAVLKSDCLLFRSIKHVLSERQFQDPVIQCSFSPLFPVWTKSRTLKKITYFQKKSTSTQWKSTILKHPHFQVEQSILTPHFTFFSIKHAKVSCKKLEMSCVMFQNHTFLYCTNMYFKKYIFMLLILLTCSTVFLIYKS